jgi:hypothetical protein
MNLLLPLLVCLIQDPQIGAPAAPAGPTPVIQNSGTQSVVPPPAASGNRLDVLKLKNGDELVGRVTAELDGYVEIEIEDGATIGVSRAQVLAIVKGAVASPMQAAVVRPDNSWFLLHDADGASVGWLHSSISTANDGSFTVNEEYEFINGKRRYQITNQCTADASGHGVRCYYRERVSRPKLAVQMPGVDRMGSSDRIEDERIVEATAGSGKLHVAHLDSRGRSERELPWSEAATFPLLARTLARQAGLVIGPVAMFDPQNEQLVVSRIDGTGARQLMVDGIKKRVTELAETDPSGGRRSNREWLDADMKIVRRELAGPALVAVPSSAESARSAVGVSSIESAIVAEADGRFALWIPNPAWVAVDPLPKGHLMLQCAAHDAEVRLSLLDHLPVDTVLETAADAVANWIKLLYPQLQVDSRYDVDIRGRAALRMSASDVRNVQRAMIDVIPFDGSYVVLICRSSQRAWEELATDFAFIRRTIELDAAGLNPKPQGPLSRHRGGQSRAPSGPLPAPKPVPRVSKSETANNVRIPK